MPKPVRAEQAKISEAARGAIRRLVHGGLDFGRRVYTKAGQDDIFFLGGGIAFNLLLGAIPFLFLLISIFGFVLQAAVADPQQAAIDYVVRILPASPRVVDFTRERVVEIVEGRTGIGVAGLALFVWASARLFGSLRSALRSVFDVQEDRGVVGGKLFDLRMVLISAPLFAANTVITGALEAIQSYGVDLIGLQEGEGLRTMQALSAQAIAFSFIFIMFLLIYRYLPARRIAWRIAAVASLFTSVAFELLKSAFAWYIANVAVYSTTYGYLATAIILVFWIYYSSVVFVLGGEVAQVYELYRIRRRQRELLD